MGRRAAGGPLPKLWGTAKTYPSHFLRLSDKGKYENMVNNNSVSVRGDRRSWKDCMYAQIPCKGSFRPQWLLPSFIKILESKYRSKKSKITFPDTVQKVLRYHNQQEAHKLWNYLSKDNGWTVSAHNTRGISVIESDVFEGSVLWIPIQDPSYFLGCSTD